MRYPPYPVYTIGHEQGESTDKLNRQDVFIIVDAAVTFALSKMTNFLFLFALKWNE